MLTLPQMRKAGRLRDREGEGGSYVFIGAFSMARPLLSESKILSCFCPYNDPEKIIIQGSQRDTS